MIAHYKSILLLLLSVQKQLPNNPIASSLFIYLQYSVIDIDECSSSPCLNGATCYDFVASFACQCASGFSGTDCRTGNFQHIFKQAFLKGIFGIRS